MADKKSFKEQPKGSVKFQESNKDLQVQQVSTPLTTTNLYKDAREQREICLKTYNRVTSLFKMFTSQDPECNRKDTATALKNLLESLKEAMNFLNQGTFQDKVQNYYLLYNATIYMFDICRVLRKSVYQSITIEYLASCITSMEANLLLTSVKYLDWRTKLYMELANIYFSMGSCQSSLKTIELAIQKVNELREIEEVDPPLPDYIDKTLIQNLRNLRILDLKFRIQSSMPADQWRKKLDDYFSKDPEGRCIAIIESLRLPSPNLFNTVKQTALTQGITWKEQILAAAYEILKPDIDRITLGLEQQMEKITKKVEFKQNITYGEDDEQKRIELTNNKRQMEATMIKTKEWIRSAQIIPLEYQVELAHHAYDCGNIKLFEELTESAFKRCKYRRIEVPFIVDVDLLVSDNPNPNVPNGHEKIQVDINEANLRAELKKLRNRAKADIKDEKKDDPKKDDKKKAPLTNVTQTSQNDQVGMGVFATDAELRKISHTYVFLIFKTSMLPENAIYEIDVVMADENDGPVEKLQQGYRAIAIPIKQYTGVRETNKTIPYLLIKNSADALTTEDQKMNLITDIKPLFGKNPLIRPDYGYQKILCDLRQTPKEFIRSPNMDYVFLTYKTDKYFHINEREVQILTYFNKLEKTYQREKSQSVEDDARLELDICYDLNDLKKLINILGSCLIGPLGENFLYERKDFLFQLVFQLWRKYFISPIYQFDFIQEQLISKEIPIEDYDKYKNWIDSGKQVYKEGLLIFNQILFKIPQYDIILLCKINLALSKYLEENNESKSAVDNLRQCLNRIEIYRNSKLARGVDSQKDLILPFSITCSNRKIKKTILSMKEQYVINKNLINREIRKKSREGKKQLECDEENEEEFEVLEAMQNYLNDDNRDQTYFKESDKQIEGIPIDNINLLINALHADILINIYRCQIKSGRESQKRGQSQQIEPIEGVASQIVKKMNISKGPTAQNIKKNLNQLQTTLQKEGKIEAPKPLIHDYEKDLMQEANKNVYSNCLLYMVLASNKQKQPEQKSLLQKSLDFLKEADKEEEMHLNNAIKDAIFVLSTLLDNSDSQSLAEQYFPFNMLYHPDFIKTSQFPRKPILICRSSNSVTYKLPPFKPQLIDIGNRDQSRYIISSMAIFGKISANGVNVALTCDDLPNTGTRQKVGGVVCISHLNPNDKYCFAVAGYDGNEGVANGIGETGEDISMLHPLPLPLLASYLSKMAYQLSHFDLAEEAADICIASFTEDSDFLDRVMGNTPNPIYLKRLIQERLREVGLIEINNLTETLLIKAKCMKKKLQKEQDDPKSTPAHWERQCLRVCNFLLLSLETCLCARSFTIAKRIIGEMYNNIDRFLLLPQKPIQIFHILLKAQMVILEIPKQYWDTNLRILSAKYTYEILKISLQINEITLGRRILFSHLQTFNRKWYQVPKMIMVEEQQQQTSNQGVKKDIKKDAKKPIMQEENISIKMVPKLVRMMYEIPSSLQDYLEETILSMYEEYGDFVPQFIDRWKEQIECLLPYVENPQDQLDRAMSDLSIKLEFWDYFKDPSSAFSKVQLNFKSSPMYMEITCKLLRRMLESGTDIKLVSDAISQIQDQTFSDAYKLSIDIRDAQFQAVSSDIEFYPPSLPYLENEKETNKQGNDEAIKIFQDYFDKKEQLEKTLQTEQPIEYGMGSLLQQAMQFNRIHIWQSEINQLRAVISYQIFKREFKTIREVQQDQFASIFSMDLAKMKQLIQDNETQEEIRQQQKKINSQQSQIQSQQQTQLMKPGQKVTANIQTLQPTLSEEESLQNSLEQIFKHISYACYNAIQAKEYGILQNNVRLLLNILNYEQISPFQHKGTDCWRYLAMIGMCINQMLKEVREFGFDQKSSETVRPHVSVWKSEQTEPQLPVLSTQLSKEFWFSEIKQLEIDLFGCSIAYITSSLMVEKKWNLLIGLTRDFCNSTTHFFSIFVLPFTVYAQKILLEEAQPKRIAKEKELHERTKAFELWVQTKKKKTRSAILTQEVAPEEIDYLKDKEELERQITLLNQRETFIKIQLEHSEKLIGEIQRDANQAIEGLKSARKLYEKYSIDDRALYQETQISEFLAEEKNMKLNDGFLKQRRKNHKQLAMQIISRYKLTIEVLRKRQEKFALALALKELGNLNYAIGNLQQAEEMWNDSLDTIFQRIYILRNSQYRKILQEQQQPLAQTYGVSQCLIGLNLCATLTHYCYYSNCHQQREAQILASELVFSIFKMHLPNAMSWSAFTETSSCEFGELGQNLFNDRFILDPAQTLISCERISWNLIDSDNSIKALPLLNLMKRISLKLGSHFYTIRAMLLQSIALSSLGFINESFQLLVKVQGDKDLPQKLLGQGPSLWQSKQSGENWFSNNSWNNSIPPYDEKHIQMTETILKDLQVTKAFGLKYGFLNENLYNYALSQLIYNIHYGDIVEKWEINEQRVKILHKIDVQLRNALKKIAFEEELDFLIYLLKSEEQYLRLQGEEIQATEFAQKKKEEIAQFAKQILTDNLDFEQYYNLLSNKSPIGLSNNEENLQYYEKRIERLHMMVRIRSLLIKVNTSIGLVTRALFISKSAIENISQYCFEVRQIEQGEEPENNIPLDQLKTLGIEVDKKSGKAPVSVKDDKKAVKGGKQVDLKDEEIQKKEEEKKLQQTKSRSEFISQIVEQRKSKRCINVYWWIKLRTELVILLYRDNRLKEANELIDQLQEDVKLFTDHYHERIIIEYQARILIRYGKPKEAIGKFELAIGIAKQYSHQDQGLVQLYGDYAEILRERHLNEESIQLLQEAFVIADNNLKQLNYTFGQIQNNNVQSANEQVTYCTELQIQREAEEELLRKNDRISIKGGKKDDKKGKDDSKNNKKGPNQQKIQQQPEKPQMKVNQLNPLPNLPFNAINKLNYSPIEIEGTNNNSLQNNCYFNNIEVWLRSALRYVEISQIIYPLVEDSKQFQDSVEPSIESSISLLDQSQKQLYDKQGLQNEDDMQELLNKIDNVINVSYNIPISFRLETYYLQAKVHRRRFVRLLINMQNEYFKKYLNDKNKKHKNFWEKRPHRDLVRNKYFLDVPGFCQIIKEQGMSYLTQAKESLKKAIIVIRGEVVLFEHFRKPEDILTEMAEICLLIREYRPRIRYRFLDVNDLQKQVKQGEMDLEGQFQKLERSDKLDQLNLELESFSYLKYANELFRARNELCQQYHTVGQASLQDVSKLPLDIFTEVIEQDYIYKKAYPPMLFDESKKKTGIVAIDLLVFMQKAWRESRIMTFSGNYLQRFLSKAHRYLKLVLPTYQKCLLTSIEVAPKADVNAIFIDEGAIVFRSVYDRLNHDYKFTYVLGALNKDKLSVPKEERDKILINEEKEVLYGSIYIQEASLSILLQDTLDLKSRMQESDIKSAKAKERDYKNYRKIFYKLFEGLASYFFQRTQNEQRENDFQKRSNPNMFDAPEGIEIDLLDKYGVFIPELTHENIDLLVNLFNETGLQANNNHFLTLLRYFHQNKYR